MIDLFSAYPEQILLAMGLQAGDRFKDRIEHYSRHGIEIAEDDAGTLFWLSESEAVRLFAWITEHSEDGKVPDELCPLISELADMLRAAIRIEHVGEHGDPDLN